MEISPVKNKSSCTVLVYHRILPKSEKPPLLNSELFISEKKFERQIELISKCCQTLSVKNFRRITAGENKMPSNAALVTFDDGYRDVYLYAAPILKKYNVPFVFSIVSDYVDGLDLPWPDVLSELLMNKEVRLAYS